MSSSPFDTSSYERLDATDAADLAYADGADSAPLRRTAKDYKEEIQRLVAACSDEQDACATFRHYRRFEIPKRPGHPEAGVRVIHAPRPPLMALQHAILRWLCACKLAPSRAGHAYMRKRSIKTMAEPHVGRHWLIKFDLQDFFHAISLRQLRRTSAVRGSRIPAELMIVVADWCFLDGGLPMGAPTSPFLSNLVAAQLDHRLLGLCRRWRRMGPTAGPPQARRLERIAYTRYADDLVFSSDYPHLPKIMPIVKKIIHSAGFMVNEKKTVVAVKHRSQRVCGVVVSRRMSKARDWRRVLRAQMHNACVDLVAADDSPARSLKVALLQESDFARWEGMIAHVAFIDAAQAAPFRRQIALLRALCLPPEKRPPEVSAWVTARKSRPQCQTPL